MCNIEKTKKISPLSRYFLLALPYVMSLYLDATEDEYSAFMDVL
nr:MAG TPA: hypothetical protein [Caudoviricetes sp.]